MAGLAETEGGYGRHREELLRHRDQQALMPKTGISYPRVTLGDSPTLQTPSSAPE